MVRVSFSTFLYSKLHKSSQSLRFNNMSSSSDSSHTSSYHRFASDQCQFRHNEQATNDLLHEWGFIMQDVEGKAPEFYALLQEIGWGLMVEDLVRVNESCIREFYANLPTVNWSLPELVVYVQGRQFLLTSAAINEVMGLPNPPKDELNAQNVDGNG